MTRKKLMRVVHGRGAPVAGSFIALALMPLACSERANNSDTSPPVVVTERGVEILTLERDEVRRTVEATVSDRGTERRVTIAPLSDGPSPGLHATIGSGSEASFEVSIAYDETARELWVRERTAVDEMVFTTRVDGERVFETWEINGRRLEFDHPLLTPAQLERAVTRYRSGGIDESSTPLLREVGEKLAVFDAYYTPAMTNTLHNNPDGDLLVSLLTDPTMAGAVTGEDMTALRVEGTMQRLCFTAALCVNWKCSLGGLGNPLCVACVGVHISCLMAEFICWFAGCDCCY